jgi:hypothetical protein
MRKPIIHSYVKIFPLVALVLLASCQKDDDAGVSPSSIKVVSTVNEPKQVEMVTSSTGKVLVFTSSGKLVVPAVQQELMILAENGDVDVRFSLSDTVFQHIDAVPGLNGGYFLTATSNGSSYIGLYQLNDEGQVQWSGSIQRNPLPVTLVNTSEPEIVISRDGNYLILYQSGSNIYRVWKGDAFGNTIHDKKFQSPNAVHDPNGLNYGQKYVNLLDANDSILVAQGILDTEYSGLRIENCFIRTTDHNLLKKDYSSNYSPDKMEIGNRLVYNGNKIVLFGSRADNREMQFHGDIFAREYSLTCDLDNEIIYPRVGGTPTAIHEVIDSPDGGWLLIGSNGQFPSSDLVSPNNPVLMKIRPDLSLDWAKSVSTGFPARGFDAEYLSDGTIGLVGLLKDRYKVNKLMYVRLTSFGDIINN